MGKIKTLGRYEDPEVNKISSQQFESDYERSSMAQAKVFFFPGHNEELSFDTPHTSASPF